MIAKYHLLLTAAMLMLPAASFSSSIDSVVVYGDSLSDNGNLSAATFGLEPGSPYYMGRRSNGPVAVEQLASLLGAKLDDFAWIGATTGIGNIGDDGTPTSSGYLGFPGMLTELKQSKSQIASNINGLFVVWGGPDDFLSPSPQDKTVQQQITRAVGDLITIVDTLKSDGATHILVPGMPDLGLTPSYASQGTTAAAAATALTNAFNAALISELPGGVIYFDTASLLRSIVNDPSEYGFKNVTGECYNGVVVCADPSNYLFFDDFHPTTQADAILAQDFFQALAVPEPATALMLGIGLSLVLIGTRKRNRDQ